jgi:integrative and conjugative element protein (TIGR02256 family)
VSDLRRGAPGVNAAVSTDAVLCSPWAVKDICLFSRMSADGKETGGILLGFDATPTAPLTITLAGDPGPRAVRSPTRFRRDLEHAQALADAAWAQDGSLWVGDWHTHPAGHPVPSRTDLSGYRGALHTEALPVFLSIIISPDGSAQDLSSWSVPEIRAWVVHLDSIEEAELTVTS